MTIERKKAIVIIVATLLFGILIGVLSTGMLARHHYRGSNRERHSEGSTNRRGFVEKIIRVTDADAEQAKQMKPILENTVARLDSIQDETRGQAKMVIDSMTSALVPILKQEQVEKLKKFNAKMGDRSRHGNRPNSH